jgi:hypothetical protein
VHFRFVLLGYWIVALFKLLIRKRGMCAVIFLTVSVTVCSRLRCRIRNFRYIYKYDCMEMANEEHFRSSNSLEINFVVSSARCMVSSHCARACVLALCVCVCVVFSYCVSYPRVLCVCVCVCVVSSNCVVYPLTECGILELNVVSSNCMLYPANVQYLHQVKLKVIITTVSRNKM